MALRANDAYAGSAEMPNGQWVDVEYLDAARLLEVFGRQPPGHPARKRVGWYWHYRDADPRLVYHGRFTSSAKAMLHALAVNQRIEEKAS